MLRETIDNLIKTAMLNKKKTDLKVLRLIKAEFQTFETSMSNKGVINVLDDVQQINILKKLKKSWEDERDSFKNAGRDVTDLNAEIDVLNALIPSEPSDEEYQTYVKDAIHSYMQGVPVEERKSMKHLGAILKILKAANPLLDSKKISAIYREIIGI